MGCEMIDKAILILSTTIISAYGQISPEISSAERLLNNLSMQHRDMLMSMQMIKAENFNFFDFIILDMYRNSVKKSSDRLFETILNSEDEEGILLSDDYQNTKSLIAKAGFFELVLRFQNLIRIIDEIGSEIAIEMRLAFFRLANINYGVDFRYIKPENYLENLIHNFSAHISQLYDLCGAFDRVKEALGFQNGTNYLSWCISNLNPLVIKLRDTKLLILDSGQVPTKDFVEQKINLFKSMLSVKIKIISLMQKEVKNSAIKHLMIRMQNDFELCANSDPTASMCKIRDNKICYKL